MVARPMWVVAAGSGEPLVLLHAFGLSPQTYRRTLELLSEDGRVLAPWWGRLPNRWSFAAAVDSLVATLDAHGIERATLVGHSAGGALAVSLAAAHPDRVHALVAVNALVLSPGRRELARLSLRPRHIRTFTTLEAARDFVSYAAARPRDLASIAMWGLRCHLADDCDALRAAAFPRLVLWGRDDSLLPVSLGEQLADAMGAQLVVAAPVDGERIEHDWPYRRPMRFAEELRRALARV